LGQPHSNIDFSKFIFRQSSDGISKNKPKLCYKNNHNYKISIDGSLCLQAENSVWNFKDCSNKVKILECKKYKKIIA